MKAFFDLGDAASCVMDETWVDASLGQKGLIERLIKFFWRRGWIEPTNEFPVAGFQDQCFQPLSHLSLEEINLLNLLFKTIINLEIQLC